MVAKTWSRTSCGEYACFAGNCSRGKPMTRQTSTRKSSLVCARWLECDLSLSSTAQSTVRSLDRHTTKSKCFAATRFKAAWRADALRSDFTVATSATRTFPKTR